MIVRHVLSRQFGPRVFSAPRLRLHQRFLTSTIDRVESAVDHAGQETHSLDATTSALSPSDLPIYDPKGNAPHDLDETVQTYLRAQHDKHITLPYGSNLSPHYEPHALVNNPPSPSDITLELLLASQAHLGHSTSLWNPANARYIFGIREGIHIISLDVTAAYLRRAAKIVSAVTERAGLVLFVGSRPGFDRCVVKAAELAGGYHLFERWTPGTITNGQQILAKCETKVVNEFDQTVSAFDDQLNDRAVLKPDLVVCLNPMENYVMLHECGLHNIPTIGIIDTDANPTWVTYPIPANDDSLRCVQVIAGVLGRAGEEGKRKRLAAANEGVVDYYPADVYLTGARRDGETAEDGVADD